MELEHVAEVLIFELSHVSHATFVTSCLVCFTILSIPALVNCKHVDYTMSD